MAHLEAMSVALAYCSILVILMLFYLYHFNKRRDSPVYRKRLLGFVFSINICAIFFVGYLSPMWILTEMTQTIRLDHDTLTFYFVLGLPYIICQHLFTLLIFCRFWLLHFEIKWTTHNKMLGILSQIDPNAKDISWYIKNRVSFGNPKVCLHITLLACFVFATISSIVYFLCFDTTHRYIWYITDSVLLTLPVIGCFIIWSHTPPFFDLYLIRKELFIIMICDVIGIIGYIITTLSLIYASATAIFYVMLVGIAFGATIYCAIALVSTFWVLQFQRVELHTSTSATVSSVMSVDSDAEHSPRPSIPRSRPKRPFIPNPLLKQMQSHRLYRDGRVRPEHDVMNARDHALNVRELTLYNVLAHPYGFYAFLCHATKEYSAENLLAVVEMQQFQTHYRGKERDIRFSIALKHEEPQNTINGTKDDEAVTAKDTQMTTNTSRDAADAQDIDAAEQKYNEQEAKAKRISRRKKRHSRKHARMMSNMNELLEVTMAHHSFYLPQDLPQSAIVYNDTLTMREKILSLCDKYIVRGSEFELNLGSSHRMNLLEKRHDLNAFSDDDCAACFNDTIYAVIALMHDSFIRFQLTNSYEELRRNMLVYSEEKRRMTLA